ncbi:unnamed protein product [Arctogadus glacialis]
MKMNRSYPSGNEKRKRKKEYEEQRLQGSGLLRKFLTATKEKNKPPPNADNYNVPLTTCSSEAETPAAPSRSTSSETEIPAHPEDGASHSSSSLTTTTKDMNAMGWIQTLLISGLCIPSFCADYRQHCLIETPKSWSDAQSYCRERGPDLATIDDMGAMKSLLALNADRAHDELWIGLHYVGLERWHWSLADKDFYQEGERDYRNFRKNGGRFAAQRNIQWDLLKYGSTLVRVL